MAEVTNLSVDRTAVCPQQEVVFIAETDPPDEVVGWTGFPLGSAQIDGNTARAKFRTSGTHTITANLNSSSETAVVTVFGVEVQIDPGPVNGDYAISAEPQMPVIAARAAGIGAPVSSVLEWRAITSFFANDDCHPIGPPDLNIIDEFPQSTSPEITLDFGDTIRGRRVGITVNAVVSGCEVSSSGGANILGTNPPHSAIDQELPHNTLPAIACMESGKRQFDAPVNGGIGECPFIRRDGAVGIMGIKSPSGDETWNWKKNVAKGIEKFNQNVDQARDYPQQVRISEGFNQLILEFNAWRQEQNLPTIPQISLRDFTQGNFDDDLQELERDAIRGYDGWFGQDRFELSLHEYRVALENVEPGREILKVINIDELAGRGEATWEPVPIEARPGQGDPGYVDGVLAFLFGCNGNTPQHSCKIDIITKGSALSFSPNSPTGKQEFEAHLSSSSNLPSSAKFVWKAGAVDPRLQGEEMILANPSDQLKTELTARHPNKVKLKVAVQDGSTIICDSGKPVIISVPQFVHIVFNPDFDLDLEKIGLRRRPPAGGGGLTSGQIAVNGLVKTGVISEILGTVEMLYSSINVRFTTIDPAAIVGAKNVTTVRVGGLTSLEVLQETGRRVFGFTSKRDGSKLNPLDTTNIEADELIRVFSGEFADRSLDFSKDPLYASIFDTLAIEDHLGNPLPTPGNPVDTGDLQNPSMVRSKTITAALTAFGRTIGSVIAHECGHAIGSLPHNRTHLSDLMDTVGTFQEMTGITSFDPLIDLNPISPVGFNSFHLQKMSEILPILS